MLLSPPQKWENRLRESLPNAIANLLSWELNQVYVIPNPFCQLLPFQTNHVKKAFPTHCQSLGCASVFSIMCSICSVYQDFFFLFTVSFLKANLLFAYLISKSKWEKVEIALWNDLWGSGIEVFSYPQGHNNISQMVLATHHGLSLSAGSSSLF